MAGAVAIGLLGTWLIVQAMAGRLPARLLSFRQGNLAVIGAPAGSASSSPAAPGTGPVAGAALAWPLHAPVTQEYGHNGHPGIDLGAPCGTPIQAAAGGTVQTAAGSGDGYGNKIVLDHGAGLSTLYGHLSAFAVQRGDQVSAGQTIGAVGTTGNSTGCHLHLEVRTNGTTHNPRDYIAGAP